MLKIKKTLNVLKGVLRSEKKNCWEGFWSKTERIQYFLVCYQFLSSYYCDVVLLPTKLSGISSKIQSNIYPH